MPEPREKGYLRVLDGRAEARTNHAHLLGLFLFNKDTQD